MWVWTASLRWFGNLPLKAKLYISFGWMCLFTLILGAVSLAGIQQIRRTTELCVPSAQSQRLIAAPGAANLHSTGDPAAAMASTAIRFQWIIGSLLPVFLLLNFVMAWRLAHLISHPILEAYRTLERISQCDLTVVARVESSDEAGRMCEALNRTINHFHGILATLMQNSDSLENTAGQLAGHLKQSADQCEQQNQLARKVLEATQLVAGQESTVAHNSHDTAEAVRTSRQTAQSGSEIMANAVHTMEMAETTASRIRDLMSRLDGRSQEITKVVSTIREISQRTNLLALNASIEAARAGEHGHGFAVVATEVRRLAEHAHAATQEIEVLVHSIQDETANAAAAAQTSQASIENGRLRTVEARQTVAQIIEQTAEAESLAESAARAAKEQSAVSRDIATQASEVAQMAVSSLRCSRQVSDVLQAVRSSAVHLGEIVHQFRL